MTARIHRHGLKPGVCSLRVFCLSSVYAVALFSLTGCKDSAPPPPVIQSMPPKSATSGEPIVVAPPAARHHDYVGSAACADCHSDISRSYSLTTMANSTAAVSDAHPIETYEDSWVVMSRLFRAQARHSDEGTVHTEQLMARDGSVLCEHAEKIAYEVGSGKRGRSYLLEHRDQLMMSPLTWYSAAGRWDLSPGYAKNNLHFERPVIHACMQCHAGRIAPTESPLADRIARPAFLEPGIGCERCHGPAGRHVEFQRERELRKVDLQANADPLDEAADPIVNPGKLAPHLRESVCNECHQLGVERVQRFGFNVDDFRPGEHLSSVWVVFKKGDGGVGSDGSTEAVNQVGQMESSRCFQKSEGRLGCVSCHDPHSLPQPEMRTTFYRDRCLNCHSSTMQTCSMEESVRLQDSPEDSCIQCHMPALPTADVQHTSQTDHRVLRKPSIGQHTEASDALELAAGMDSVPVWEVQRARGLLMVRYAVDLNDPALATLACELLENLSSRGLNDSLVEHSLGEAYLLQNRLEVAEQHWNKSLSLDPHNEKALRSLAFALHDAGRDAEAERLMAQYLSQNQWDRNIQGRHIHVLGRLGRHEEALKEAEIAVKKYPFDRLIRDWLAKAYNATSRNEEAKIHREIADRLSP